MRGGRKNLKQSALQGRLDVQDGQAIMRVISLRGSNIIEVEDQDAQKTLCLLPAKFNKSLWIRRGSYVVVDEGEREKALESGNKVTGIITQVLFEEHVRALRKSSVWPAPFKEDRRDWSITPQTPGSSSADMSKNQETFNKEAIILLQGSQQSVDGCRDDGSSDEEGDHLPPLEINHNRYSAAINRLHLSSSEENTDSED